MRMRHIAICGPAPLYNIFSTLSPNRDDFLEEKKLLDIKCVFWFSLQIFLKHLSL